MTKERKIIEELRKKISIQNSEIEQLNIKLYRRKMEKDELQDINYRLRADNEKLLFKLIDGDYFKSENIVHGMIGNLRCIDKGEEDEI